VPSAVLPSLAITVTGYYKTNYTPGSDMAWGMIKFFSI
jgi:hypothetical protein